MCSIYTLVDLTEQPKCPTPAGRWRPQRKRQPEGRPSATRRLARVGGLTHTQWQTVQGAEQWMSLTSPHDCPIIPWLSKFVHTVIGFIRIDSNTRALSLANAQCSISRQPTMLVVFVHQVFGLLVVLIGSGVINTICSGLSVFFHGQHIQKHVLLMASILLMVHFPCTRIVYTDFGTSDCNWFNLEKACAHVIGTSMASTS